MICDDVCGDVWCFVRLSEFQKAPNYETTWFWLVSPNAFLSMKGCWLNGDLLTDRLNSLSPRGKARSHKQEETAQTTDNPGKTIKSKKKTGKLQSLESPHVWWNLRIAGANVTSILPKNPNAVRWKPRCGLRPHLPSWNIHHPSAPPLCGQLRQAREGFVDESRVEGLSNRSIWRNQVRTDSSAKAWKHSRFTKVTEEDILQLKLKTSKQKHVWVLFMVFDI